MQFEITKELFGDIYEYIIDENVTDIKWNGRDLWVDDLNKGRYKSDLKLTEGFLEIFTGRVAAYANEHFNISKPSLQAETDELRIHAVHPIKTGDNAYILAIRKTPAVSRLNREEIFKQEYADELIVELIGGVIRAHLSGVIIGDVGSGKTEFEKFVASYIPDNESCLTVEDTLEMKLPALYPEKDVASVKIDDNYPTEQAIRDALRLLTKWLLIAEARGREIYRIIEGASTGCVVWTTIHTENTWEIPDRIVQMAGGNVDKDSLENNVYMFFSVGFKIKKEITEQGIKRYIDQICFFTRNGKENCSTVIYKDREYTGKKIPEQIIQEFKLNDETVLLKMLKEKGLM